MSIDYTLWPNADGKLGDIKVQIPDGVNTFWPEGDALVHNFVYKDGKLAGFVDTKALTTNDSKSTTINYDYVNIHLDSIKEGDITFNRGERSKYFTVTYGSGSSVESFDFVIIDFNTTDQETINTVRTAKRVVDNKLYDADGSLIGTWDTSKLEVGGILNEETADGLFCNIDEIMMGERGLILSEFDSDLSSLTNGTIMFVCCPKLTSFSSNLSSLTNGESMFNDCPNLTAFNADLSSLTNGIDMFYNTNLTSFSSDLPSLMYGSSMFSGCSNLETFNSDLSNLTDGTNMFYQCKLDTASVQNIAGTINTPSSKGTIYIGIGNSTPNSQEEEAFNTIASKNWTVYIGINGGSSSLKWYPTSLIPIDGEETATPLPFWAKPVQSDKQHAQYVDTEGNFYNILGGNFIYGDNLENYGMFISLEDAAANMRLTKIEKPKSIYNKFRRN